MAFPRSAKSHFPNGLELVVAKIWKLTVQRNGYVRLLGHYYNVLEKPLYFDPFEQIEFAHLGHNIIAPCKVLVQGSILFYPFRDSGFS